MATERPTLTLTWNDPETGAEQSQTVTPPVTLGRDPTATVHLSDREVSRRHARIVRFGDELLLIDTSANGVRVNDTMQEEAVLHDGDRMQIGPYTLTIHVQHGAATEQTAVPSEPEAVPAPDLAIAPEPVATLPDAVVTPTEREEVSAASSGEAASSAIVPDVIEAEPPPLAEPEPEPVPPAVPEPAMVAVEVAARPDAVNVERDASGAPVRREIIFRLREQVLVRTPPSAP